MDNIAAYAKYIYCMYQPLLYNTAGIYIITQRSVHKINISNLKKILAFYLFYNVCARFILTAPCIRRISV